jgi:hypothetical protein
VQVDVAPQAGADWLASTLPSQCRITLSATRRWTWGRLCPVLLHEYGHLAGYRDPLNAADPFHSHEPRSIMWPFTHADPRCSSLGTAYLRARRLPRS